MKSNRYVNQCCKGGARGGAGWVHTLGIVMMAVGILILLVAVPVQVWFALIGLSLLLFGFVLWRIG